MKADDITWSDPWKPVNPTEATKLEAELRRELSRGHQLFGRKAKAIGTRRDCDDVLFELGNPLQVAVVHLTYARNPEQPPYPDTEIQKDYADFIENTMRVDHENWVCGDDVP